MANYPAALDSLTNPAGSDLVTSPDHASQHTSANDILEAIEATLGTTSGTSVVKHFAAGEFPVRATGVAAIGTLQQTIVGGTLNNNVVGTPAITGGSFNNGVLGTPTLTLSSDATGDIFFRSAGGTLNRLAIGGASTVLTVAGGVPTWATSAGAVAEVAGTRVVGTQAGTQASLADVTNCVSIITNTAGNRIMGMWTGALGANTADIRIELAMVLNGTAQTSYYMTIPKVDVNANAMVSTLHFRSGTLSTTSGTVKVQFSAPDAGTVYIGNNELTVMEILA